jgi:GNAT superfamily N-acetyltransferase
LLYAGPVLIVNPVLVDRIVRIEIDNLKSRIGHYPGVVIRPFGEAVAFVSPRVKERFFNSVQGTSPATLAQLDEIEQLYAEHGARPAFEVVPSRLTEELGRALTLRGYAMVQFQAGLVGRPAELAQRPEELAPSEELVIEEVDCDERFAELYLACWQEPDPEIVRSGMAHWRANKPWRYFVARLAGELAGAAILDVRHQTALLGSAGTLPTHRGRGVQSALIRRRIAEAAQAGCDLLVGGAYFGTSSMRNQMRMGLSLAFTRGIWVAPDA